MLERNKREYLNGSWGGRGRGNIFFSLFVLCHFHQRSSPGPTLMDCRFNPRHVGIFFFFFSGLSACPSSNVTNGRITQRSETFFFFFFPLSFGFFYRHTHTQIMYRIFFLNHSYFFFSMIPLPWILLQPPSPFIQNLECDSSDLFIYFFVISSCFCCCCYAFHFLSFNLNAVEGASMLFQGICAALAHCLVRKEEKGGLVST